MTILKEFKSLSLQNKWKQTLPLSSSSTTFDISAVINSTDFGAMSPSNHFTFQCLLLNSQPQLKGFDIGEWLVRDESNFPAMWFVLFDFCCKTDAQGGKKLPSIFFTQLITTSSFFFGWYFLRNNSSLTSSTELNFGFPYRAQVNFSMTLNSSFRISGENPMFPNTVWVVLSFSSVFNGRIFPFLENAAV